MAVFEDYAYFYDLIYSDKDYKAECDFIETVFDKYAQSPVKTVLDLGCGTGAHACLLAKRGLEVWGLDFSEQMLEKAREKAERESLSIEFHRADVRSFELEKRFDAAVSMFAVVSYQIENRDVENMFKSVRAHLNHDGIFVFDVWFGPAVVNLKPTERVKEIEEGGEKVVRIARPVMDISRHLVKVNYRVKHILKDGVKEDIHESHSMRFFFPQELSCFLNKAGFAMLKASPFMDLDKEPTPEDWNITVIARAV
jgi:ubiquinone/menaquinone biosynthesis C-methylase UbiE